MNIYDFDETIYDSDSTKDFYFYCLKKYPKILLSVPIMAWTFFLYILGVKTKTQFKEKMYRFLTYVPDEDVIGWRNFSRTVGAEMSMNTRLNLGTRTDKRTMM